MVRERGTIVRGVVFPYSEGGDAIVTVKQRKDSERQQGPILPWPSMANSQDTLKP